MAINGRPEVVLKYSAYWDLWGDGETFAQWRDGGGGIYACVEPTAILPDGRHVCLSPISFDGGRDVCFVSEPVNTLYDTPLEALRAHAADDVEYYTRQLAMATQIREYVEGLDS